MSAPANWATTYNNYFTIKNLRDICNNASERVLEFPWKLNTYYLNDSGVFKALNTPPVDWANESANCSIFIQNHFPEYPPKWKPRTFYFYNDEYILTEKEPDNWNTNWKSYYIRNSSLEFQSCNEAFPTPDSNWKEGTYYMRSARKDIQRSIIHTGVVVSNYSYMSDPSTSTE